MGVAGAQKLYQTGHGSVVMRAKCHIEIISSMTKAGSRTRNAIVVTELPYMTNKAGIVPFHKYILPFSLVIYHLRCFIAARAILLFFAIASHSLTFFNLFLEH